MVDDLIDAARTLTGQMSVVRADASLAQILRDAISTVEVNALEKSILIHVTPADFGGGDHGQCRRQAPAAGILESPV